MSMDRLELCNKVRMDLRKTSGNDVPIDAFPKKMQELLLDLEQQEGYVMEYAMTALLSAAATAIGNACRIRIRGTWQTNPMLYIILVGRPGAGKTPPLDFAYRPIVERDEELFSRYIEEKRLYELEKERCRTGKADRAGKADGKVNAKDDVKDSAVVGDSLRPPVLKSIIVSDTTAEALWRAHANNPRGIVIKADEVMGFFNTLNRYNNSQTQEQLLSAFSGQAIKVSRCNEDGSCYIPHPCVNLIGTTQTHRVPELEKLGLRTSGFLDRILFVVSRNAEIPLWEWEGESVYDACDSRSQTTWKHIIDGLMDLPYDVEDHTSFTLQFSKDAGRLFYDWHNRVVAELNGNPNGRERDSRQMKAFLITARIALVIQLLRWACGESHKEYVDEKSVEAAIRLYDFYEQSYSVIRQSLLTDSIEPQKKDWLDELPATFTTAQAIEAGKVVGMAERTVKQMLSDFSSQGILRKLRRGEYGKLIRPSEEPSEVPVKVFVPEKVQKNSPVALCTSCTFALSAPENAPKQDCEKCKVQKVQGAESACTNDKGDTELNLRGYE